MATLLKGDCLEVMKTLKSKSIDCFIVDLPYGQLTGKSKDTSDGRGCDWDVKIDLKLFWKEIKRLCKSDNTPVLMFCNTRFGFELYNSNPDWFRYDIVWEKTNAVGFLRANKAPMTSHEMIYVFSKKGAYYKRINYVGDFPKGGGGRSKANFAPIGNMENVINDNTGQRCPTSVVRIANKKTKNGHPTAKPEELYEWLLSRYCPEGGTVLDPTAGSFNSITVAKKLGFKAIGIEKDSNYFWKAVSKCI